MIHLEYKLYQLKLKRIFRISRGSRDKIPVVLTKISYEGAEGFGEAAMPTLYGESHQSAISFLNKVDLSNFTDPFDTESILNYVDGIESGNSAVKTSIDIALHDLIGKLIKKPVHSYFGLPYITHRTSMTIGIDTPQNMAKRALEYKDFSFLKIKLGTENDKQMIKEIRSVTDQPFFIDANQGWKDKNEALDMIHWLNEHNTVFVEQPMLRENKKDNAWLSERSPLPIIGDEGVQRLNDLKEVSQIYNGINIKLMKATGLREGFKMAVTAKALGMKVMLGCFSETSCGISAASHLGALADWIDLDGNLDAENDPFKGHYVEKGKLYSTSMSGIGLNDVSWKEIQEVNFNKIL